MKISTEIRSASRLVGEEKAVELIAKAGFDAWDFSMFDMCSYDRQNKVLRDNDHPLAGSNYLAFARKLKQIADDNGIECNQSHAPFPMNTPLVRAYMKRAIECTAEVGGKICVIHPANDYTPEENAEIYLELLPFAKEHGVKLATENMWNWNETKDTIIFAACNSPESFNAHLDAVNDAYLVACLDIGHAEISTVNTSAVEMIEALGSRLQALHLHDNDRLRDSHQIPFSMNIEFAPIVKALKKIGYNGYFTLEAYNYLKGWPEDKALEGLKDMAKAARRLADMFDELD